MSGIRPVNPDLGLQIAPARPVILGRYLVRCAACPFAAPTSVFGLALITAHVTRHHPEGDLRWTRSSRPLDRPAPPSAASGA